MVPAGQRQPTLFKWPLHSSKLDNREDTATAWALETMYRIHSTTSHRELYGMESGESDE
jgi:hypothetical protein